MKEIRLDCWLLRDVIYPVVGELKAVMDEGELDPTNRITTIRRIEAIWLWDYNREPLFPTYDDIRTIIATSRSTWSKTPDLLVVSPPVGSTLMGIELA